MISAARTRRSLRPKACLASAAAKAAGTLGGVEAFWKAHDLVFESQAEVVDDRFYLDLAAKLGFDSGEFLATMNAPGIIERIRQDIDLAIHIGLRGTPAVYTEGQPMPNLAREQDVEVKRRS